MLVNVSRRKLSFIVLVGLLLLDLHLPLLLSRFQPIFVLFVAILSVLCCSLKAMLLVRIYPNSVSIFLKQRKDMK